MSKITNVSSLSELERVASGGISVVDCYATWCGPCKMIAPTFERLANQHSPPVKFLKVDVDAAQDVARKYSVSAMPTFLVLHGSQLIDQMRGADPAGRVTHSLTHYLITGADLNRLERLVLKHLDAAKASSSSTSAAPPEKGLEGFASLVDSIDQSQVSCLNESSDHTIRHLLRPSTSSASYLESDADEQLLMHVPLNQSTKIRALQFTTADGHEAKAPKTIRLFVNQPTIGFDDAESLEPAQEIVLTPEQASGKEAVQLRFVRFQNVNTLSIFVKENQGDEEVTRIDRFEVLGLATEGTDMSKLKAQTEE